MNRSIRRALAAGTALGALAVAAPVIAQTAPAPQTQGENVPGLDQAQAVGNQSADQGKDIVVVGTQI